jgi:peptidase E
MEGQINSSIQKLSSTMQDAIKFIRTEAQGNNSEMYSQRLSECFADIKGVIENINSMKPKTNTLQSKISEQEEIIRHQEQLIKKLSNLSHNTSPNSTT